MFWTLLFTVVCIFSNTDAVNKTTNYVFTHQMAQTCKEHVCRDGYSYNVMFSVDNADLKQLTKDSDIAFEMHIGIQAMSNGHILLSPVKKPSYKDPVYEIVVGGGGNKFTELRRHLRRDAKSSMKTVDILNSFEMRGFYIRISQDGHVEFGKEGETIPLINYVDVDPLEIKYFSFAAWSGVEAKFLYDCPIPGKGDSITPDSHEVDQQVSASDQLKRDLLLKRQPWTPPSPDMKVQLMITVTSVKYDALKSKLTTTMSVVVSWTDETMMWFADKYNGTKTLKVRQGQIWRPKFYVFNSDEMSILDGSYSELITVTDKGEATLHFDTKTVSWCADTSQGLNKWPHDEYECSLVIQPWEVHETINILMKDTTKGDTTKKFSAIEVKNEWETSVKQMVLQPSLWNKVYQTLDNETIQTDRLLININLKRSATAYNIAFYTPLVVLVMFVLFSFWSEPLVMERVWFYAGCIIVICMGLCFIDHLIPCHTLPSILVFYSVVLEGVILALLVQVLLMTKHVEDLCNSNPMQSIFTWNIFRIVFCLPAIKTSINGGYSLQEDEEPVTTRGEDVEEMERDKQKTFCDRRELAAVLDRIFFVSYSIAFTIMLACHL